MTERRTIDPTNLTAIDVHVHLEAPKSGNAADEAAMKYFGDGDVAREGPAIVDYYRARRMACVLFTVDERLTGRRQVSNDVVVELRARANPDVDHPVREPRSDSWPRSRARGEAAGRAMDISAG